MQREYVVSAYYPEHPAMKTNFYKLFRRKSEEWAIEIGRELAEGPPQKWYNDDYSGPVLLWPLVHIEEEEDAIPR